jgi:hypothetical protein
MYFIINISNMIGTHAILASLLYTFKCKIHEFFFVLSEIIKYRVLKIYLLLILHFSHPTHNFYSPPENKILLCGKVRN